MDFRFLAWRLKNAGWRFWLQTSFVVLNLGLYALAHSPVSLLVAGMCGFFAWQQWGWDNKRLGL